MDEDYAHVAQKRAANGRRRTAAVAAALVGFLAIAALGVMAAVVAVQTDREAPANELSRAALVRADRVRSRRRPRPAGRSAPSPTSALTAQRRHRQQQPRTPPTSATPDARRAELTTGFSPCTVRACGSRSTTAPATRWTARCCDEDLATLVDGLFDGGRRGRRDQRPADQRAGRHPQHQPGRPRQRPARQRRPTSSRRSATRAPCRPGSLETYAGPAVVQPGQQLRVLYEAENVDDIRLPAAPERSCVMRSSSTPNPTADQHEEGSRAVIAALGLLLGIIAGLVFAPDVPLSLQNYLPIAVVAALDAVFGGAARLPRRHLRRQGLRRLLREQRRRSRRRSSTSATSSASGPSSAPASSSCSASASSPTSPPSAAHLFHA